MKKLIIIGIIVILGIGIYFALKGAYSPPAYSPPAGQPKEEVSIKSFSFNPAILNIKIGTKATWTNQDSASHTVTSDSGTELNSDSFSQGKSYSHIFENAGTFEYHCSIHPSMKGKVIVVE